MLASSWFDPVMGVDIHFVLVPSPAGPVPTPLPHPYVGLVYDPQGLVMGMLISGAMSGIFGAQFAGPVMLNSIFPATNCGTEATNKLGVPHVAMPPGVAWAMVPTPPAPPIKPDDVVEPPSAIPPGDAIVVMGSQTVNIMGSSAARLGDLAMSCAEPVRLPTSVILAIPKGAPVLIGGPPSLSLLDAALASIRTAYIASRLHALVSRMSPGRLRNFLHRSVCFFTGHPVDVASGCVSTDVVDFDLPGPMPLRFERSYTSGFANRRGPLGYGWSHPLDQAVWLERGKVVYLADDGREIEFDVFDLPDHVIRPGQSVYDPINRLTLRSRGEFRWEIETHDGIVHELEPISGGDRKRARLVRKRDRNGHTIELRYDRRGLLEWCRDSGGRLIGFEHDDSGLLTTIKLPLPHGHGWYPHRRFRYDRRGDLVEAIDATGASWRFEYVQHLLVRETDRVGLSFHFEYDGTGPSAYCVRTWGDGGIYDHRLRYDKNNKVTHVTHSLGHTTIYEQNAIGMVIEVIEPTGGSTKYEYDERTLQRTAVIDALGGTTRTQYDERGNATVIEAADGSRVAIEYDSLNQVVRATDAIGGEWAWHYDANGNLTSRRDPSGNSQWFGWTGRLLVSIESSAGHRVVLEYADDESVSRVTQPGGASVEFTYDGLGRVTKTRDARGAATRVQFDAEGRVVARTSAHGVEERLRYDAEGNLLEAQDEWRSERFEYGHFHKVIACIRAGQRLVFEYDLEGRVTTLVNEAGERYSFGVDASGRVFSETGFDGAVRTYLRDASGRVVRTIAASGRATQITYDAIGRVLRTSNSDGTFAALEYRLDGALVRTTNESGEVRFERDAAGRVIRELQNGFEVCSRYGSGLERESVTTSLGAAQSVIRDPAGRVSTLRIGLEEASSATVSFERDAFGLEVSRTLPGGVRVEWRRDLVGRPLARTTSVADGQSHVERDVRAYHWRGDDVLLGVIDALAGPRFFDHDARGRLVGERRSDRVIKRALDAVGNVYSSGETNQKYGSGGRLLEANGAHYQHDVDGNLIGRTDPDGRVWRYRWNGHGLLREVARPDGSVVRFEYDALARRTRKLVLSADSGGRETVVSDTVFVWDGHVVLHELSTREGLTTWYWEPATFTPIAKEHGGRRWAIASDHLGTPTEMYDELGRTAWKMQLDLFGVPSIDVGSRADCRWRWPGQYEDEETGDYYNRFRYYQAVGAYMSPDPLGLLGGLNAYSYPDDPLVRIDPLGLAPVDPRTLGDHPLFEHIHDLLYRNKRTGGAGGVHGVIHRVREQITGSMRPPHRGWFTHADEIARTQHNLRRALAEWERRGLPMVDRLGNSLFGDAWGLATAPSPSSTQRDVPKSCR